MLLWLKMEGGIEMIPSKYEVVNTIEQRYQCTLRTIKGKRIMLEGFTKSQKIVVCTPQSKIHTNGQGWFDLSTIQVELLDQAQIAILAVRLEGNKVFYIDFKDIRSYMSEKAMVNYSGVDKWNLYIWNNYITIRGVEKRYYIESKNIIDLNNRVVS